MTELQPYPSSDFYHDLAQRVKDYASKHNRQGGRQIDIETDPTLWDRGDLTLLATNPSGFAAFNLIVMLNNAAALGAVPETPEMQAARDALTSLKPEKLTLEQFSKDISWVDEQTKETRDVLKMYLDYRSRSREESLPVPAPNKGDTRKQSYHSSDAGSDETAAFAQALATRGVMTGESHEQLAPLEKRAGDFVRSTKAIG